MTSDTWSQREKEDIRFHSIIDVGLSIDEKEITLQLFFISGFRKKYLGLILFLNESQICGLR